MYLEQQVVLSISFRFENAELLKGYECVVSIEWIAFRSEAIVQSIIAIVGIKLIVLIRISAKTIVIAVVRVVEAVILVVTTLVVVVVAIVVVETSASSLLLTLWILANTVCI